MKERIFSFIAGIILFLGVLGYMPGIPIFREGKEYVALLALIVFLAVFLITNKWMTLFLLWCIFCAFWFRYSGTVSGSNAAITNWACSIFEHVKTLALAFFAYEVFKKWVTKKNIHGILNAVCIVAIAQSGFMILQTSGIWISILPLTPMEIKTVFFPKTFYTIIIGNFANALPTGFMDNPNIAASLLAISLPLFFRRFWVWFIPLVAAALIFSQSLGGIVPAIVISALWLLFFNRRIGIVTVIIAISAITILICRYGDISFLSDSGRLEVWRVYILKIIKSNSIFGYGLGMGERLYGEIIKATQFKNIAFLHPHNEYLSVTAEAGVIGLILFLCFLADIFRKGFTIIKDNYLMFLVFLGFIAGLLNCGVHFLFYTSPVIVFMMYVALIEKYFAYRREVFDGI